MNRSVSVGSWPSRPTIDEPPDAGARRRAAAQRAATACGTARTAATRSPRAIVVKSTRNDESSAKPAPGPTYASADSGAPRMRTGARQSRGTTLAGRRSSRDRRGSRTSGCEWLIIPRRAVYGSQTGYWMRPSRWQPATSSLWPVVGISQPRRSSSTRTIRSTHSSIVRAAVSRDRSGATGTSYGALTPGKSSSSPASALRVAAGLLPRAARVERRRRGGSRRSGRSPIACRARSRTAALGATNAQMQISPASFMNRATSAARRRFSDRSAAVNPRSLLMVCAHLAAVEHRHRAALSNSRRSSAYAIVVLPEPGRPVSRTVTGSCPKRRRALRGRDLRRAQRLRCAAERVVVPVVAQERRSARAIHDHPGARPCCSSAGRSG